MKISCPKCHASGTIPEHEVPEAGRFINCPRCKEGFTIQKPRSSDSYLVDTCPACGFSTFGDETFSSCPKCGIAVKTFIERQREEQLLKHNQELLVKKFHNVEATQPPPESSVTPVADFIENLHPVNLISWGVAAVSVVFLFMGTWGLFNYDSGSILQQLQEEQGEQVSGLFVFFRFGLVHWLKLLYGLTALAVSLLFMKHKKSGIVAMSRLLWATIVLVPLYYSVNFVNWVLAPIPHTISGYMIEIFNILFIGALIGVPLYFLERYLHDRRITSVVTL